MDKTYVDVDCTTMKNGSIHPSVIYWNDGRSWRIKRVLHTSTPIADEFEGIRYTVLIGSTERYLYRSEDKWYVIEH